MAIGHIRTLVSLDDSRLRDQIHRLRVLLRQNTFTREQGEEVTDLLCRNLNSLFKLVKTRAYKDEGPVIFSCALQPTGNMQLLLQLLSDGGTAKFLEHLQHMDKQRILRNQTAGVTNE